MPRGSFSSSSIISQARIFGAPDKVPAGNTEAMASSASLSLRILPSTCEQMCMILEYLWIILYLVTSTEPNSEILPKSFLPKSTNMLCSDNSFSSDNKSSTSASSSFSSFPRGLEPATGNVIKRPFSKRTKVSGEVLMISTSSKFIYTMYGDGFVVRSTRYGWIRLPS